MRCEVLLFAHLRDAIGHDRLFIELHDGATIAEALLMLASQHRAIDALRDKLAVAVNQRYARSAHQLNGGDVIALIPPVSGG
jgi:molybdopterin converting factor subunit 1